MKDDMSQDHDEDVAGDASVPLYLREWRGLSMREGDRIVEARPEDIAVAKSYPAAKDKGPVVGGIRRTIMTEKRDYRVGEHVRVIHVVEAVEPDHDLYVMGPKPVYGEYVDGRLVTPPAPVAEDYDGPVLPSPNVDYNYDITTYRFPEPGRHRIYWQPDEAPSNTIEIDVSDPSRPGP